MHSHIPFLEFVIKLAPVTALGLWPDYWVIRKAYAGEFADGRHIHVENPEAPPGRGRLLYVCLGASAVLLILLALNVHPALAAIVVAAMLILAGATRPREAFARIDWELLLMFASLFVVMGGLRQSGLLEELTGRVSQAREAGMLARLGGLSLVSAALSNVVSNVPAVVFLSNVLPALGGQDSLWLALAASSTVAGNITIIGSVANLIVFESARRDAHVGFREFFRVGAPRALLLGLLSVVWLRLIG